MSSVRRVLRTSAVAVTACLVFLTLTSAASSSAETNQSSQPKPTIVLVHGAWADGSTRRTGGERTCHRAAGGQLHGHRCSGHTGPGATGAFHGRVGSRKDGTLGPGLPKPARRNSLRQQ